jgi:hypothetical protein
VEAIVKDAFLWLNANGCRQRALDLHDELGLSLRLVEHLQGKKSAYQARKDGDWEYLMEGLANCSTPAEVDAWKVNNRNRIVPLPWTFREALEEEIERRKATLEDMNP